MIHKCICSQYSLKVLHPEKETKTGLRGPSQAATRSWRLQLCPGEGGADRGPAAPSGQMPGRGSRADLAIAYQVSANKVLTTSVPLPREGGRGRTPAGTPNPPWTSPTATGPSQAGRGSVTTPSSSRPWTRPRGPGPPPGASRRSPTWSGRSRTSGSRAWACRQEWSRRR